MLIAFRLHSSRESAARLSDAVQFRGRAKAEVPLHFFRRPGRHACLPDHTQVTGNWYRRASTWNATLKTVMIVVQEKPSAASSPIWPLFQKSNSAHDHDLGVRAEQEQHQGDGTHRQQEYEQSARDQRREEERQHDSDEGPRLSPRIKDAEHARR
jgi:hypothetical protein